MIGGAIGAFFLIRSYGLTLVAPPVVASQPVADAPGPGADVFVHVLLALSAVILTELLLAKGCAYLGQPPVIGEVIAGIVTMECGKEKGRQVEYLLCAPNRPACWHKSLIRPAGSWP
jgi:hypothetical protein